MISCPSIACDTVMKDLGRPNGFVVQISRTGGDFRCDGAIARRDEVVDSEKLNPTSLQLLYYGSIIAQPAAVNALTDSG